MVGCSLGAGTTGGGLGAWVVVSNHPLWGVEGFKVFGNLGDLWVVEVFGIPDFWVVEVPKAPGTNAFWVVGVLKVFGILDFSVVEVAKTTRGNIDFWVVGILDFLVVEVLTVFGNLVEASVSLFS